MDESMSNLGERRKASRFGRLDDDDFAAVWLPNCEPILAEVHDESLHGIRLIFDPDCGIGLGSEVHIVYAGHCHLAQARHVATHSDGRMMIGFQCERIPEVPSQ